MPSRTGVERRPERDDAGRDARLDDEGEDLAPVGAESALLAAREPAQRRGARRADDRRREELTDRERAERGGDADRGADDDRDESDAHRHREQAAAQVVAAAEEERARGDVLGSGEERDRRCRGHRRREAVRPEERVRERRDGEDHERRERAADQLHLERAPEETVQLPPVLGGDVPEPELRQALLDGEVEERLREPDDGHHRREAPEVGEAEHPSGGDRAEDAEGDREVEPGCGRRPAPENARSHRGESV